MADKTKSIKGSTNKELDELIGRLRKENIDSMYHVGVLGMHWGRRKAKGASSKETDSEDHVKKTILKKKNIRAMSNTELKTLNERMQLEKQYKELTKTDMSSGKKFVADILVNAAKQTASTYVSKYMGKGMDKLLKIPPTK